MQGVRNRQPDQKVRSSLRDRLLQLLVLVLSIAGCLTIAELGLRVFRPQPMNGTVFEYAPRGYSVIKSKGSSLFTVGDRRGVYHFISPHLRGAAPPSAGATRVLVLGDSFTFGVGLSDDETYVSKLQQKFDESFGPNQVALLNAGIGGSGTAEHLAFLEDFGNQISPREVVVFVSIDDFNRAERSPLYRLRSAETLDLSEGVVPTSSLKKVIVGFEPYNFVIEHFHSAQLIRQAVIDSVFRSKPAPSGDQQSVGPVSSPSFQQRLARALFKRMRDWCASHNADLAIINNGWRSYDWLPNVLASEGITSFDAAPIVQPVISREDVAYVIPLDGHPNPRGATLTADAVWPFLRDFIQSGRANH
jgi:lysophospholipase L1-like esterase